MKTKKLYKIKLGYRDIVLENKQDAYDLFDMLSTVNIMNLTSNMIDDVVPKDKDGYRPYTHVYYLDDYKKNISLETIEVDLYSKREADAILEKREKELEKIDKASG